MSSQLLQLLQLLLLEGILRHIPPHHAAIVIVARRITSHSAIERTMSADFVYSALVVRATETDAEMSGAEQGLQQGLAGPGKEREGFNPRLSVTQRMNCRDTTTARRQSIPHPWPTIMHAVWQYICRQFDRSLIDRGSRVTCDVWRRLLVHCFKRYTSPVSLTVEDRHTSVLLCCCFQAVAMDCDSLFYSNWHRTTHILTLISAINLSDGWQRLILMTWRLDRE